MYDDSEYGRGFDRTKAIGALIDQCPTCGMCRCCECEIDGETGELLEDAT